MYFGFDGLLKSVKFSQSSCKRVQIEGALFIYSFISFSATHVDIRVNSLSGFLREGLTSPISNRQAVIPSRETNIFEFQESVSICSCAKVCVK